MSEIGHTATGRFQGLPWDYCADPRDSCPPVDTVVVPIQRRLVARVEVRDVELPLLNDVKMDAEQADEGAKEHGIRRQDGQKTIEDGKCQDFVKNYSTHVDPEASCCHGFGATLRMARIYAPRRRLMYLGKTLATSRPPAKTLPGTLIDSWEMMKTIARKKVAALAPDPPWSCIALKS